MKDLSKFQTITTWLTTITNSENTKKKYTQVWGEFIDSTNINPDQLVEEWKQVKFKYPDNQKFMDKYTDIAQSYYSMLIASENLIPATANNKIQGIISFFKFYRISLDIRQQKNVCIKYHNRSITKEEIKRIFEHSTIREKAFYLMMLESGLRPRTLCQLKYEHIKQDFEAGRIPMLIQVPAEIVKDRIGNRFSFVGSDGYNALKEYLSTRNGLTNDAYLFVEKRKDLKTRPFLSPETFANSFSRTVLKLRLTEKKEKGKPKSLRLYCLRKYFRNKIRVDMGFREFWMGHKWGTDEHYISRDVELNRERYKEAYPSLRIYDQPNPRLEELDNKYEELKKQNEQLMKDNEELKKLKKEVEELKELNALLKKHDVFRILEESRKQEVEWVDEEKNEKKKSH